MEIRFKKGGWLILLIGPELIDPAQDLFLLFEHLLFRPASCVPCRSPGVAVPHIEGTHDFADILLSISSVSIDRKGHRKTKVIALYPLLHQVVNFQYA